MTKLNVNIGLSVNDKTGDTLRTAFSKINSNFTELYDRATNTDGQTLTLVGNILTIVGGNSVTLPSGATSTGNLRFTGSLMHPVGDATRGVVLTTDISKMNQPTIRQWEYYPPYEFAPTSAMYIIPADPNQIYDPQTVTVELTNMGQSMQDEIADLLRYVSGSLAISVNGGANQPVTNRVVSNGTALIYFAVPQGFTGPALVTSIQLTATFENRIQLDDSDGSNYGVYVDQNFAIDSTSDINLVARDDLRLTGADYVALRNTSRNDPVRIVTDYDRYEMEWRFDTAGTLSVPQALPRTFTAILDTFHQSSLQGAPIYTQDAWQLSVTFQINAVTGGVETVISPTSFVQVANPGYESGYSFTFGSSEHGIPNYDFVVVLQNVAGTAGNYTADLVVSAPPIQPPTVSSPDSILLQAGTGSPGPQTWQFGSDGVLTLPPSGGHGQINSPAGVNLSTDRGNLTLGVDMEFPGSPQHFHIAFDGSNSSPSANDLFLGDDLNYVKLPGVTYQYGLGFVQAQTDYLDVASSSDWALGTTWTIEFWSNAAKASTGGDLLTVMCQNYDVGGSIDLMYIGAQVQLNGNSLVAEPSSTEWTHVALVSDSVNLTVYYNGVSVYTGGAVSLNNTTDPIRIGARGPADFQRFDGQLALIRISNTVMYATAFAPTTTYGVETGTKLFLGGNTPLTDTSASAHPVTNHGVGVVSTTLPSVSNAMGVEIATNNRFGGGHHVWRFDTDGQITFPDASVQTKAWAGIPGPYADDAAAATASVAVGNLYHKTGTGGAVYVRLT